MSGFHSDDVVAFVSLPAPDEFSSRSLCVFRHDAVLLNVNGRGSVLGVHMTKAEARAIAEAILANVPEPVGSPT